MVRVKSPTNQAPRLAKSRYDTVREALHAIYAALGGKEVRVFHGDGDRATVTNGTGEVVYYAVDPEN